MPFIRFCAVRETSTLFMRLFSLKYMSPSTIVYEKFFTFGSAGIDKSSSFDMSSNSYSVICVFMFCIALSSSSPRSASSYALHVSCIPNGPLISFNSPITISGLSKKYWFTGCPVSCCPTFTHSGIISVILSLFCRKIMSDVTSVPALALKVLSGNLIAPISSAL